MFYRSELMKHLPLDVLERAFRRGKRLKRRRAMDKRMRGNVGCSE